MIETTKRAPLTVAFVHGAFADSSSWNGVIELLQADGVTVTTAPNPLRGITHDSAYVASFLNQIPGPVLLVGHSYGGAVITNAGLQAENVVGLVYVAGFAPDEGETLLQIEEDSRDSVLLTALVPLQYPTGNGTETATEFAINPEKIQEAFAADLSRARTPSWPPPSGRSRSWRLPSRRGRPPGSRSRPGRWSLRVTRPSAATCCGRWPSAPAPQPSKSMRRTWS